MAKIDISSSERNHLLKCGMRDALLDKLNNKCIKDLVEFSMDNNGDPNLYKMLVQLASMEAKGKEGSIYLAKEGLATPTKLKDLTAEQIKSAVDDYKYHDDAKLVSRNIRQMIIINQQEKIFQKSGGMKGEYFIDQRILEDTDDDSKYYQ